MPVIGSARRLFAIVAVTCTTAVAFAAACKTPTQVTIDVSLLKSTCAQTNGTAIIAAGDPAAAEARVAGGYPSAVTTSCDDNTKDIGTLVLTPGDSDRGAVVVVVSFSRDHAAADCRPPLYADCVVARRSFAFVDHQKLTLPIEVDFDCVNVPCDSKSTCRQGQCYSSDVEVTPGSDTYQPPGIQGDGAPEDSVVPDAGTVPTPVDDAGVPVPVCQGSVAPKLECPDSTNVLRQCTGAGEHCWIQPNGSAQCNTAPVMGQQLCCSGADCASGNCQRTGDPPGTCAPTTSGPTPPYCDATNVLHCFGPGPSDVPCPGATSYCCSSNQYCAASPTCADTAKLCCVAADCPSGTCARPGSGPGTCTAVGQTTCDNSGTLVCAGEVCASHICCPVDGGALGCAKTPGDCTMVPDCCSPSDCPLMSTCPGPPIKNGAPTQCIPDAGNDAGNDSGMGASCAGGMLDCPPADVGLCPMAGCCGATVSSATCMMPMQCMGVPKYCCKASDCPPKMDGGAASCSGPTLPNGQAGNCN